VLFDVPNDEVKQREILGRFDLFGRQSQLSVYVLVPSNGVDDLTPEHIGLIRKTLRL